MTMFYERLVGKLEAPQASTVEEAVRAKMHRLIKEFNASSERGVKAGEMFCGAFESAPMTVIALSPPVPFHLGKAEELDERPHALFLTAGRKSLGS